MMGGFSTFGRAHKREGTACWEDLIGIELDVENFPLTHADAGMTTLVGLVTIMAAEVVHGAVRGDGDLID